MSEETKTKERTDQVTLWDKVKASVVAFFTTSARSLKELLDNRPWIKYVAIVVVILALSGGFGLWRDRQLTRRINTLGSENQAITQQIKVVSAERDEIKAQYEALKKQIMATQVKNDSNIKEAVKNAYIKGSTISDSNILDAWNDTIRRSRERNAERKNNFANN